MNRKLTRDQNDISIIIGNLPKRLQKKIADETGATCSCAGEPEPSKAESLNVAASPEGNQNMPQIDMFLRMSATSERNDVVKSVASIAEKKTREVAKEPEAASDEFVSIPGILRIKTGNVRTERSNSGGSGGKRASAEHGRKQQQQRYAPTTTSAARRMHPVWFDALLQKEVSYTQILPQLHDKLLDLMQRKAVLENWSNFNECHAQLQIIYAHLLLHHLKFCCEQKVETYFWKLLFYNVIEHLKSCNLNAASTHLLATINSGLDFYADLLGQLSQKYLVKHNNEPHKYEFIAKVSAQKLFICLGDLSRYKSKILHLNDFTEAANYYQRAQELIPTNGIPYNQLAILAIYNRKKFDAIYFHMRSLMSSNAICSARESLQVLFDEIRKKYEESEMKTSPIHLKAIAGTDKKSKSLRKEVWIHPDGVRCLHRTDVNGNKSTLTEESRLNELSADELLRRFTSLYLYCIGKLFSGIGMESIQEHQAKLLIQMTVILRRRPLSISLHRLLKMAALNIFSMEHNKAKDTRREIRYHAFVFCNQIFGLLLRKCNELFAEYKGLSLKDNNMLDLNTLLQFVRIWCIWLAKNVSVWEPLRSDEQTLLNTWSELQLLFDNIVVALDEPLHQVADDTIFLEEDRYLVGFAPICTSNTMQSINKTLKRDAQVVARMQNILQYSALFSENQRLLENVHEKNFCLEDLTAQMKTVLQSVGGSNGNIADIDNSENIVNNNVKRQALVRDTNTTELAVENAQIAQLSKLKKQLEAKSHVKKMYSAKLEEILKFVDTKLYIEVRPKYLLPDTNCFIDCLEDFEQLVQQHKRYVLIIPLTVVKELDGLAKGVKIESYEQSLQKNRIHHFDDVSTRAMKSLDFIKTSNNSVKCATTKGSIINASLFALVEEEHVSNDDKILATALALSKTLSTETKKDGKCLIQTELVLITTDRNLRVKALSRNLAVSELTEFQQWANDCKQ